MKDEDMKADMRKSPGKNEVKDLIEARERVHTPHMRRRIKIEGRSVFLKPTWEAVGVS